MTTYPVNVSGLWEGGWNRGAGLLVNDSVEVVLAHTTVPPDCTFPLSDQSGVFYLSLKDAPLVHQRSSHEIISAVKGKLAMRGGAPPRGVSQALFNDAGPGSLIAGVEGIYLHRTGRLTLFANAIGDVSVLVRSRTIIADGATTNLIPGLNHSRGETRQDGKTTDDQRAQDYDASIPSMDRMDRNGTGRGLHQIENYNKRGPVHPGRRLKMGGGVVDAQGSTTFLSEPGALVAGQHAFARRMTSLVCFPVCFEIQRLFFCV